MKKKLIVFTDGGARGNPGPAAIGVVIKEENGKDVRRFGKYIGETTNNVAEYKAVIEALTYIKQQGKDFRIVFFLDSQLVASQLSGLYKIKKAHLQELVLKIKILEQEAGGDISYRIIPRENNGEADSLVNQALDEIKK